MNPAEEMRPGKLQVILALVARDVCAPPCPWLQMTTPRVICSSAVAAGLFLDVGNSHPLGNVVCMHHFIVICLSKPWCVVSVVFVAISGLSVAHGVLRDVVFWAWKHDVMYKIRGRSFNLLIHIYICICESEPWKYCEESGNSCLLWDIFGNYFRSVSQ